MKFRKLRIAWSVFWGLAAVLLVVLWVRSYSTLDLYQPYGHEIRVAVGTILIDETWVPSPEPATTTSEEVDPDTFRVTTHQDFIPAGTGITIPFLFPTVVFAIGVAAPWLPYRFSVRALLIATTIIAAGLGLIVAVLRWPAG